MASPEFCMVYHLDFLGSGPHFDELAHYFSFEQIIHTAVDGYYSSFDSEATAVWKEIIECTLEDMIDADYSKPPPPNKKAIIDYYVSQMSMYSGWLSKYITHPNEGYFTVVTQVIIHWNDVYVVCDNLEGTMNGGQLQ